MNDNQNKESLFVPTRACKSKKRIELRRSSPLTVSSEINEEKKELSLDEIGIDESDMEIMAIIAGNDTVQIKSLRCLKKLEALEKKQNVLKNNN